jgi:hypothetical protein
MSTQPVGWFKLNHDKGLRGFVEQYPDYPQRYDQRWSMHIERIRFIVNDQARRAAVTCRGAASQPMLVRILGLIVIVAIAIPLAAIILGVGVIAAVGVAGYLLFRKAKRWLANLLPRDDSRENVRVIRQAERNSI